jgi:hypothetical protein
MTCEKCKSIVDVSDDGGPYTIRICEKCGRQMRVRERGKHSIGLEVRAGDQVVIPAGFISMSANPLKSTGRLFRKGLGWFVGLVFGIDISGQESRDNFVPYIESQIVQFEEFLKSSELFKGINLDDPSQEQQFFDTAVANKQSPEWFALVAANMATFAKEAIANKDAMSAAWAMASAERFRSLWIFKQNFEEAVWMGQSARTLTEILSLWEANKENSDEGFWQIKLQEASYVFSQLFSVPLTFIKDKAYVGGQQIDGKSGRLVDFLFSGGASGEAILIEIKTPKTPLLQKSKYRSSVHAPDSQLSGSIVQAADYRNSILRDLQSVTRDRAIGMAVFNPKIVVIIGNYAELDTEEKRRSFELFRSSVANIEIVTFDELFRKVEQLAKLFNLVRSPLTS